ncbi:MAG: MBL fold metallo-hydrolase [Eubacterium sp.]|nr:MBL fold metallo-hydrolase [Eubacterium sp.]
MKIIYLHHSGFIVELERVTLVFDAITNIQPQFLRKGRKNYFFVTHSHHDHFSQHILSYGSDFDTTYILSDDIPQKGGRNIHYIAPYQTLDLDGIHIETFGSTDRGVSFYVEAEGRRLFHAGDLNWWDWDTESHPNINPQVEERDYKAIVQRIKDQVGDKTIEVAFVPVDSRLQGSACLAAEYFIDQLHPQVLVPMHFWEDFSVIKALRDRVPGTQIPDFNDRNQIVYED